MNDLRFLILAAVAASAAVSCRPPVDETRTIETVSPYSTLSDEEIGAKYQKRMTELNYLNEEMKRATQAGDFVAIHAAAKLSLDRAHDARNLARHLDDPQERDAKTKEVARMIGRLERILRASEQALTGGGTA